MASVFLSALLALTSPETAMSAVESVDLDRQCYGLMAQLAEHEDPRISAAGITGAQYFLGRIDASGAADDRAGAAPAPESEQGRLLGRCSDLMGAGGRDFRAIGERLVRKAVI
jgi:hypothetical protein